MKKTLVMIVAMLAVGAAQAGVAPANHKHIKAHAAMTVVHKTHVKLSRDTAATVAQVARDPMYRVAMLRDFNE